MTEKVVSLSGGLVLGMGFALVLGIGSTQTMTLPLRFEYPAMSNLTITQDINGSSAPAADTTPGISVAPPSVEQDRGRITRIATSTETVAAEITAPFTTTENEFLLKSWAVAETPKNTNTLQRANLQHSYMACNPTTSESIALAQIARGNNFDAIAEIAAGNPGNTGQPSYIEGKQQTPGSPSIAHNNPGGGDMEGGPDGSQPAITGEIPSPRPTPDDSSDETDPHITPRTPSWQNSLIDGNNPRPGLGSRPQGFNDNDGPSLYQPRHRPETD